MAANRVGRAVAAAPGLFANHFLADFSVQLQNFEGEVLTIPAHGVVLMQHSSVLADLVEIACSSSSSSSRPILKLQVAPTPALILIRAM
jgi:hypothetical protein